MSESDLERALHRRGQELVHKLLQGHLEQRSPREAAGPVEGGDEEALEAHGDGGRRLHGRAVGAQPGGVAAEWLQRVAAEFRTRRCRTQTWMKQGYCVGRDAGAEVGISYGAESPLQSLTRSPASTPYCDTGSPGERVF